MSGVYAVGTVRARELKKNLQPAGHVAGGFFFASASIRASNAEGNSKLEIGNEEKNRIDYCDRCGDPALFLQQGSWASRP